MSKPHAKVKRQLLEDLDAATAVGENGSSSKRTKRGKNLPNNNTKVATKGTKVTKTKTKNMGGNNNAIPSTTNIVATSGKGDKGNSKGRSTTTNVKNKVVPIIQTRRMKIKANEKQAEKVKDLRKVGVTLD